MATIKSYTSLEQAKELLKILPHQSADMSFNVEKGYEVILHPYMTSPWIGGLCWSLAALLDVMRIFTTPTAFSVNLSTPSLTKTKNGYKLTYTGDYTPMINNELGVEAPIESMADNSVDACVEAIIKLHEQKLL